MIDDFVILVSTLLCLFVIWNALMLEKWGSLQSARVDPFETPEWTPPWASAESPDEAAPKWEDGLF